MKIYIAIKNNSIMNLCRRELYYTKGYIQDYDNMISKAEKSKHASFKDIYDIALDIYNHSDLEELSYRYLLSEEYVLDVILENILNKCCIYFVEDDGELILE